MASEKPTYMDILATELNEITEGANVDPETRGELKSFVLTRVRDSWKNGRRAGFRQGCEHVENQKG